MKWDRSNQKLTKADFEKFEYHDTRYYGVFYTKTDNDINVKIDPKRFKNTVGCQFLMYKPKLSMQGKLIIFTQRRASITIIVAMCLWTEFRKFETIGTNIIKNL